MILIITHKADFTADFVIDKLNKLRYDYYRLNCEDILLKNNISIELKEDIKTNINGTVKFDSVWFRRTKYPELNEYNDDIKSYCFEELDSFFSNLWLSIEAEKWLSQPDKVYLAENKLLQLKKAREIGFKIPETIVTGNNTLIREFYTSNKNNVIIKPIFNNRYINNGTQSLIFTNKLKKENLEKLEDRLALPSIFQKCIEKDIEYRVTVVNEDLFIASVDSQSNDLTKIDWRRKKLKFSSAELPVNIKDMCLDITKALDISFGAIDLIRDKKGDYYFLEINPNGQWAWIEIDTGLQISQSIIEYLKSPVLQNEI